MPSLPTLIQSDSLISIWRTPSGKLSARGKRVPSNHPLSHAERRKYVELQADAIMFCKFLMQTRQISLADAWKLTKEARGHIYRGIPEGYTLPYRF